MKSIIYIFIDIILQFCWFYFEKYPLKSTHLFHFG